MPEKKIRVIQFGLGPIGLEAARLVQARKDLDLVGAVDLHPERVGRPLSELLGVKTSPRATVVDSIEKAPRADAVIHCAGSRFPGIYDQLAGVLRQGLNVISSAEELLYPRFSHPDLAEKLDRLARKHRVTVLGTGVNPGFVMDTMVIAASAVCHEVKGVRVHRVVNAATRREPLQRKVGAGMSVAEFRRRVRTKELGHVGLLESMALIGRAFGWDLEISDRIRPVVAEKRIRTRYLTVEPGQVAGINHQGWGKQAGKIRVHLHLEMYVGEHTGVDEILLDSLPPMRVRFEGGTAGDPATVGILVNGIRTVLQAEPGVKTMVDVPVIHWRSPGK